MCVFLAVYFSQRALSSAQYTLNIENVHVHCAVQRVGERVVAPVAEG